MLVEREPAVAGCFYPGDPSALSRQVASYLAWDGKPSAALAVIAPHAGYQYSGAIAGQAYARVRVPDSAVVICPNHTGFGARRSLWAGGAWKFPGGEVPLDIDLVEDLRLRAGLTPDLEAHRLEHAIEVQLPFLRARNPEVKLAPICLAELNALECVATGEGIAQSIRKSERDVLLVASTDMSHYLAADEARELDEAALERVQALDPEGLYRVVHDKNISMCGFIPTTVVLAAARALGAKTAKLVRYGNSGEASGDYARVVGYASLVIR